VILLLKAVLALSGPVLWAVIGGPTLADAQAVGTFTVNSTIDAVDANPVDGEFETTSGQMVPFEESSVLRVWLASILTVALMLPISAAPVGAQACEFRADFKSLREEIPDIVGRCLENELFDATTGNFRQRTSGGMIFRDAADQRTSFTDGHKTWIYGPNGLQHRLNTERFPWETGTPVSTISSSPSTTKDDCDLFYPVGYPTRPDLLDTTILIGSNHAGQAWCWNFAHYGKTYQKPKVVAPNDGEIFRSACTQQTRSPYYCGKDETMVLPKSFFRKYDRVETLVVIYTIVAHEHAHHTQKLLDLTSRMTDKDLELQADCSAGWMYGLWEDEDKDTTEEMLTSVNLMFMSGDDGHGTGRERFLAFMRGYYQVNDHDTDGGWGACISQQDWK
jgi:hypothetical protein